MTLVTMALPGCGENATTANPDASAHVPDARSPEADTRSPEADTRSPEADARVPFELAGKWLFLGPSEGLHNLTITDESMEYSDVEGKWSSKWSIKSYDNGLHHFQMTFVSGDGTYLPTGQSMSATYEVDAQIMSLQLAGGTGSYPTLKSPGSCTESDSTPIPDCRLYMKM
jgi:hypothetical protein